MRTIPSVIKNTTAKQQQTCYMSLEACFTVLDGQCFVRPVKEVLNVLPDDSSTLHNEKFIGRSKLKVNMLPDSSFLLRIVVPDALHIFS